MASPVPVKTQQLHNFSLPLLKWTKNHANNHHRGRRLTESPPPAPADSVLRQSPLLDSVRRQSPFRDSTSESDSGYVSENRKNSLTESGKNGFVVSSPDHIIEKSEKRSAASDGDGFGIKEGRSKIYIRLRSKNKPDDVRDEGKTSTEGGEGEESAAKTWNLRPRRPIRNSSNANGGASRVGGSSLLENKAQWRQLTPNRPESSWWRSGSEADVAEKKEKKQKFSVSLSRQEIEEDIFAITGSKPPRRPKKRAKTVQKQLDNLFPGLWLTAITPDLYKVSEAPAKG